MVCILNDTLNIINIKKIYMRGKETKSAKPYHTMGMWIYNILRKIFHKFQVDLYQHIINLKKKVLKKLYYSQITLQYYFFGDTQLRFYTPHILIYATFMNINIW